jgi:CRP-like cAMP-binding protein
MQSFRAFISIFTSVTDHDWEIINPCLEYKIIQQGRVILKPGAICNNLYFLENGLIRYFKIEEELDTTIHSLEPPFLFTAAESFVNQKPSEYGIQAMDESFVWVISRDDAYKLTDLQVWNTFLTNYFS